MSFNGSGTFNINSSGQPVVTATVISSTVFNALTADLATGLSTCIAKDGQSATTARIPFASGINSTLATDATSTITGSILTAGGIGCVKALWVGGLANIAGALTVTGHATLEGVTSTGATGTGAMVFATTPTLVTPVIGVATGTSLALSGNLASGGAALTYPLNVGVVGGNQFWNVATTASGTAIIYGDIANTSGKLRLGLDNSTGTGIFGSGTSAAYASAIISTGGTALIFGTNNAARVIIDAGGNTVFNASGAGVQTTATTNFPYIPSCAGVPTGVPASTYTGALPLVYDSTNNKLYVYNGAWKGVTLA